MFGKHNHNWKYMFSQEGIQWFYCGDCLAQACTELSATEDKVEKPIIFEVKSDIVKKQKFK